MIEPEISRREIYRFLNSQNEWLLQYKFGKSFPLDASEIEIEISHNKLLFSFLDDKGFQTWRVKKYEIKDEKLFLELMRNFEKENETVILIPRVSAGDLSASVEIARIEKAGKIAALIKENNPKIKLIRIQLNKENGRLAQIFFENSNKAYVAAIADVSESLTPEILISTSILQLVKLQRRKKNPIDKIRILADKKPAKKLQKLHALLKENWKSKIEIFEISFSETEDNPKPLSQLEIENLWREKAGKIQILEDYKISDSAREIVKFASDKIDVIFSKQGETLRFHGLPFARVRRVLSEEKVWFGVEKEKQILSENTAKDFFDLIENLEKYRRFDSPNKRHLFYDSAPEAWLESLLRRNIKLLDANLILSPVYHQFRAEREKIDLLALRKDGRLVIIELKVTPDREMIFQAADYWRKIELQRRKGNLNKAKIFGDSVISDKPAICYLVAPTLSFHPDFNFLSQTISDEIEIHRFNLAENWRDELKVLGRE
ncbi:hypothetical protein BH20ACI4_BH20ACI4_29740 [soil metagenome]